MTFEEIIHYRRSVRNYQAIPLDTEKVKHCIELATLAPNSSNMQLWEFYHITSPEILKQISIACLGQESATTAKQMVVFVTCLLYTSFVFGYSTWGKRWFIKLSLFVSCLV